MILREKCRKQVADGLKLCTTCYKSLTRGYGTLMIIICLGLIIYVSNLEFTYVYGEKKSINTIREGYEGYDDFFIFSRYLGGSNVDVGEYGESGVALGNDGNIFVVGSTESSDFPTLNAYDSSYNGGDFGDEDGFVTKLSREGSIIWSTFLGGKNYDMSYDIVVDSKNNLIVTGKTHSDDFPTVNGYNEEYGGSEELFITKFDSNGIVIWSTFLGGYKHEDYSNLAVDSNDNILITGWTHSNNFPILNASDSTLNGTGKLSGDAFVTKFSENGSILWSTFMGGDYSERGYGINVDSQNNVIVTGMTSSIDFPILNSENLGSEDVSRYNYDAFIAKFDSSGTLLWSTRIGVSNFDDYGKTIGIDSDDSIFLAVNTYLGYTSKDYSSIVYKFTDTGVLEWQTRVGGKDSYMKSDSVTVGDQGNVIVAGNVFSSNLTNKLIDIHRRKVTKWTEWRNEGFLLNLEANGSLSWVVFIGGHFSYSDSCKDIAVDEDGNIIITGWTQYDEFPTTISDNEYSGEGDAFVSYLINPYDLTNFFYTPTTNQTSIEFLSPFLSFFLLSYLVIKRR